MRLAVGLAAGALLVVGSTTTFAQPASGGASADVKLANGQSVGTATFTEEPGGVRLRLTARGLPPGQHGIHVHETGKCDGPDFMSAGAHFNPTTHQHGLKNPQGAHGGDLPNLTVGADGSANFNEMLKDVSLGSGANSLLKTDGTALVIHAAPDDEMTDPSGNSGARLACGLIMRAAAAAPAAQPSPAAAPKPATTTTAPAAQPSPAAKPAAPAQAPAAAKPAASPAALPRTGSALPLAESALPAALTGLAFLGGGLAFWRRRR